MEHVWMTCENHPTLRWHCKSIAVSSNGRYNGSRNIFFEGESQGEDRRLLPAPECSCPSHKLISMERWKAEHGEPKTHQNNDGQPTQLEIDAENAKKPMPLRKPETPDREGERRAEQRMEDCMGGFTD